jgi:hypothetical protein
MKERRAYERFKLALPTKMQVIISEKAHIFNLQTKDISASGALLLTTEGFSEGTRCQLEIGVANDRIKELTSAQSLIRVEGTVVCSTPDGVAICFDGECQILGLKGS